MIDNINVEQLKLIVSKINIIDIRSVEKYNSSHIQNSINIPFNKLLVEPSIYLRLNETYYIYCSKGIKSLSMCIYLSKLGYKVININGGYEKWLLKK